MKSSLSSSTSGLAKRDSDDMRQTFNLKVIHAGYSIDAFQSTLFFVLWKEKQADTHTYDLHDVRFGSCRP